MIFAATHEWLCIRVQLFWKCPFVRPFVRSFVRSFVRLTGVRETDLFWIFVNTFQRDIFCKLKAILGFHKLKSFCRFFCFCKLKNWDFVDIWRRIRPPSDNHTYRLRTNSFCFGHMTWHLDTLITFCFSQVQRNEQLRICTLFLRSLSYFSL